MLQLQLCGHVVADSAVLLAATKMVPLNTPTKERLKGVGFCLISRSYCV